MKSEKVKHLADLLETVEGIEKSLELVLDNPDKNNGNILALHWHDIDAQRFVRLDDDLSKSWKKYKLTVARRFSTVIKKQIERLKKELRESK